MDTPHKPIGPSQHAKEQLRYRGCSEEEIRETIQTCSWEKAELDRLECKNNFVFNSIWNKREYKTKQVRPIFIEDGNEIVVITVYVYYF